MRDKRRTYGHNFIGTHLKENNRLFMMRVLTISSKHANEYNQSGLITFP